MAKKEKSYIVQMFIEVKAETYEDAEETATEFVAETTTPFVDYSLQRGDLV